MDIRVFYIQFFSIYFTLLNDKIVYVAGQAVAVSFVSANGVTSSASSSSSLGLPGFDYNFYIGQQGNNILQQLNTNFNQFVQSNFPVIPQTFLPPNIMNYIPGPQNIYNGLLYNRNNMNLNNNFPNINGNNRRNPAQRPNQSIRPNGNKHNGMRPNNNKNNNNHYENNNINKNMNNGNINNNKNLQKPVINPPQRPILIKPNTQANFNSNSNKRPKPTIRPQLNTSAEKPSSQLNPNKNIPSISPSRPVQTPNQARPTKPQSNFKDNSNKDKNPLIIPKPQPNVSTLKPSVSSPSNQGESSFSNWMIQTPNPEFGVNSSSPNFNIDNTNGSPLPPINSNEGSLISAPAENPLFKPVPPLRPTEDTHLSSTTNRPYKILEKLQPGIIINPDSPYFINGDNEEQSALIDIKRR